VSNFCYLYLLLLAGWAAFAEAERKERSFEGLQPEVLIKSPFAQLAYNVPRVWCRGV